MLKIALTGGIATGKSYVLQQFMRHGVPCLDADELSHGVTAAGTEAAARIAERFGRDVLDAIGAVDRHKLAPIVFSDPAARRELEAIVHPGVFRAITAGLRGFQQIGGSVMAVVDIPLLFEAGRHRDFDRVVATVCPEAMQIARLVERGLTVAEAHQRLAAQIPAADKAARADYVIRTDGSFADTDAAVQVVLTALLEEA